MPDGKSVGTDQDLIVNLDECLSMGISIQLVEINGFSSLLEITPSNQGAFFTNISA